MVIRGIKQTLPGVFEITPDTGSAFFLRTEYLNTVKPDLLVKAVVIDYDSQGKEILDSSEGMPGVFNSEQEEDILNAALIFSAERAALTYLNRAEHSRYLLTQKLLKKGISRSAIEKSLDYLESVHYLDDSRFASAWLRSRAITHAEGRNKIFAELSSRGISRPIINSVLDQFFAEKDPLELCQKAFNKLNKTGTDPQKIREQLLRRGFSLKEIKSVLEN